MVMMASNSFGDRNQGLQIGENHGRVYTEIHQSHTTETIGRACLQSLGCPDSFKVKNQLKAKDKLHRESWEWILKTSEYESWMNDTVISLLWIKGGAGKGKTMMAIGLIEEMSKQRENTVAYFFCQNADPSLNTLASIIKGLILGLVTQHSELKASLLSRWDTKRERFIEDISSWRNLWDILLEMLANQCKLSNVYLLVDALDECMDGGMAEFLRLIVRTGLNQRNLKWLLTSRPLDIAERVLPIGDDQTQVSLELNSAFTAQAVEAYIKHKVDELSVGLNYNKSLKSDLQHELSDRAEGTFLWVSLVCKRLEEVPPREVLGTIQGLPPGLHALYDTVMDQIRKGDSDDVNKCMQLLKVMMLSYRPLHLAEIPAVTGLTDSNHEKLISRCASFLRRQQDNIEFVHQSARDYLGKENAQAIFQLYTGFGHRDISLSCLSQLSEGLKVNLLDLLRPDSAINTSEPLREEQRIILSSLGYAATFWVRHLEDADQNAIDQNDSEALKMVGVFLHTKFLEWLECLSLLGQLSLAREFIEKLEYLVMKTRDDSDTSTLEFLRDAARFLPRHHHTITHWPLQIYSSAIIFSPESSIVRIKNLEKAPGYLRQIYPIEKSWSSLIQTLESDYGRVSSVAFSPDGKWVALGYSEGNITIWDSAGSLLKTIAGHSSEVTSVAFSPDSETIASGSRDYTVKLWSLTGALEKILNGHSDAVCAVAFSSDSQRVASGSEDHTVRIWNSTGDLENILESHSDAVYSVAFSPDNKRIASTSADHTIRIWNSTGDLENILKGHSNEVRTVVFSPDGEKIASGSDDFTIKVWDLAGVTEKTLSGHSRRIAALAFSPDGTRIVSGSHDNTLKFWTVAGVLEKTSTERLGAVHVVEFSPDIKRVAVSGPNATINIRNIANQPEANNAQNLEPREGGHEVSEGVITKLKFSPNGKQIATCSWSSSSQAGSNALMIWDATTGKHQKMLGGRYGPVIDFAFSPSGSHLASSSLHGAIYIWSTATAQLERTFEGLLIMFSSISFLPDGVNVITGSAFPRALTTWNTKTGRPLGKIVGHHSEGIIEAISVSPCGKYVASAFDGSIEIWSTAKFLKTTSTKLRDRLCFGRRSISLVPLKQIDTSCISSNHMKFSTDGQYLLTEDGPLMLGDLAREDQSAKQSFCSDLFIGGQWIRYGDFPFLRLPGEFQPIPGGAWDVKDDTVAIGLISGQVLILNFQRSCIRSMFGQTLD